MRNEGLNELVKLCYFEYSAEELAIFGVYSHTERHLVLTSAYTILNDVVYNLFKLSMFFILGFALTALDVSLNAFVYQNFSEFILDSLHVKLATSPQSVLKSLIVVIKVKVELSKEQGNQTSVGESIIFVKSFTR